jgi:hypothetical protein
VAVDDDRRRYFRRRPRSVLGAHPPSRPQPHLTHAAAPPSFLTSAQRRCATAGAVCDSIGCECLCSFVRAVLIAGRSAVPPSDHRSRYCAPCVLTGSSLPQKAFRALCSPTPFVSAGQLRLFACLSAAAVAGSAASAAIDCDRWLEQNSDRPPTRGANGSALSTPPLSVVEPRAHAMPGVGTLDESNLHSDSGLDSSGLPDDCNLSSERCPAARAFVLVVLSTCS